MTPAHRGVALMAALAAAALLLTLDFPVVTARLRSPPDTLKDRVSEKSLDLGTVPFTMSEAERVNTLRVLQVFAAAMPSLGWSGEDFCSWSGVRCLSDNVSIILARSWVTGTLPEMPDDVDYSMVRLNEISIFSQERGITGTLPRSWGKLRMVQTINLAFISISGTLPAAWSSMESIEQIIISNTKISGTLPEAWSAMRNLRRIHFQQCHLHGSLPESWVQMPSLERLDLRRNNFCGCVPQLWLTSRKVRVDIERRHKFPYCQRREACVETTTPEPIASSVSSTATFELTTLPPPSDQQCKVPNCISCLPWDSKLCGVCINGYVLTDDGHCMKIPEWEDVPLAMTEEEWWNTLKVMQAFAAAMPSLGWSGGDFCSWRGVICIDDNVGFVVSNSWVAGSLPEMPDDVDYSMVRLDHISIFSQQRGITGTLPKSWGKLRTLRTIKLAHTAIIGTLPESWGKLRTLRTINLAYTGITGTLPHSWRKLRKVRTIDLAFTGITGTLPHSWRKLRKVRSINLAYTGISGTLPAAWSSMEAMEEIMMFNTGITGTLPEAWSALLSLRRINLQGCNLYGSLPESWARMPSLERLGLFDNHFCGCVPESWLRSPTLVMGVDARHRMAGCATAEACTGMASIHSTTRNSDDQVGGTDSYLPPSTVTSTKT